jgi:phosphoserine phosphatase
MNPTLRRATDQQLWAALRTSPHDWSQGDGQRCLVVDADRTLSRSDTGRLVGRAMGVDGNIRKIFEDHGYEEAAFSRVAVEWATLDVAAYTRTVHDVAEAVVPHASWLETFSAIAGMCPVVVVTAGIPLAWRLVLARFGHGHIPVVGGCHPALDSYVVCPETKADLVRILKMAGWTVAAAGDSLIDLPMLKACDLPLFVADHKGSPGLAARLHEVPGVRHFAVDGSRRPDVATCDAMELTGFLLEGVLDHADEPNRGANDAFAGGRHSAG